MPRTTCPIRLPSPLAQGPRDRPRASIRPRRSTRPDCHADVLSQPILALTPFVGPTADGPGREPPQPLRYTRCSIQRVNIRPIKWAKSTWVLLSTESISIEVIGKVLIGPWLPW